MTLDERIADRLCAYAETTRRPVSYAAAALITSAMNGERPDDDAELRESRRQVEQLTAVVQALGRQRDDRTGQGEGGQSEPRWEWPIEVLLADAGWWDRWLPRLRELLGRRKSPLLPQLPRDADGKQPPDPFVDARGYNDLLIFLFPPIVRGAITVTWRSPGYPDAARRDETGDWERATAPPRADVWEPVIRHVAEALCLLESSGQAGADPYLRLRAEAEITGPWASILRYVVGEADPKLPSRQLR